MLATHVITRHSRLLADITKFSTLRNAIWPATPGTASSEDSARSIGLLAHSRALRPTNLSTTMAASMMDADVTHFAIIMSVALRNTGAGSASAVSAESVPVVRLEAQTEAARRVCGSTCASRVEIAATLAVVDFWAGFGRRGADAVNTGSSRTDGAAAATVVWV